MAFVGKHGRVGVICTLALKSFVRARRASLCCWAAVSKMGWNTAFLFPRDFVYRLRKRVWLVLYEAGTDLTEALAYLTSSISVW